ncbi:restriction endonuclease subunit S [Cecembia lonarensis]|uniref:Type I restriction modification DNA specificity domain protein n=1 Tax=Cecembia lonarensis (strain CCUG 58316 / KCTC 22772 / LW9) TaxID=1225176 RepID=K1KUK4_CECL9|nr:restriction endonuclease subunit S [Cecembia lonarensis]EKB47830.1 Type I restriction modification DNA specificity domain protein [Cecembia lonarensis LW9]
MNNWKRTSLGNFISLQRGYDLTSEERKPGSIPVFGAAGHNGFHNEIKVKGPGIVVGRSGGSFGQAHFVKEDFWPHNTAMFVSDFKGNNVLFTFYLLKSLDFSNLNSGSAQPSLNRNYLYDFPVFVPSVEDQQKIASILSAIDDKIELNNKINAELEGMAKLMYDYWFVQFDFPYDFRQDKPADETSNAKDVKPYKSSGGKMVWNKELKREVPEGWGSASLLDIAIFDNGLACQKFRPMEGENSYPVIKIREMRDGITPSTERASIKIPKKNLIDDGDILFSWSASLEVMQWTGGKGALNQHIFKVHSKKYPKSFYYMEVKSYLKHFKMIAELRKTTMGHITIDHLKQSRIVLPPFEIIKELDKLLEPIFEQQLVLDKQNQELSEKRDWLLPMLMNGQVRVDRNYELKDSEIGMAAEPGEKYN